jgi:hypothetical protein
MINNRLSQINAQEARLQLSLAIYGGIIATIGIYFIGMCLGASNSKAIWIKPACSALTVIAGSSVLCLRRIVQVDEYLRQTDRDILMQARQDSMYQLPNIPRELRD